MTDIILELQEMTKIYQNNEGSKKTDKQCELI